MYQVSVVCLLTSSEIYWTVSLAVAGDRLEETVLT